MMTSPSPDELPVGEPLSGWSPPPAPWREVMQGRHCLLEPLDAGRHAAALFAGFDGDPDGWTYLPYGPFDGFDEFRTWIEGASRSDDPLFFAIIPESGSDREPAGVASYLRITPGAGSIEVGHIHFGARLKHTPAGTEAMFLMMDRAFELGYRRLEWKCDSLNARSRSAAERLGLTYEGTFRQATVYKGRNRDTAWYSAIDHDWPALKGAFHTWLDPANFDGSGRQRRRLRELTSAALR